MTYENANLEKSRRVMAYLSLPSSNPNIKKAILALMELSPGEMKTLRELIE